MFAIIEISGHQHKVQENQEILADLTGHPEGEEFKCEKVMLVGEGADVKIGNPYVSGAVVTLKVAADVKGDKIHGFTYKKRQGTHKAWGHRQKLQKLQVVKIKS